MQKSRNFARGALLLTLILGTSVSAQRITAMWHEQQLGVALERLAGMAQTPLWLDRRVDPRQTVNAQFTEVSVGDALAELAAQHDLGVAMLENVVYIGPEKTARGMATLSLTARTPLSQAPAAQRKRWLHPEAWSWPRLSEPRALLADLLRQANVDLVGGELVTHDLWPARELPPLALVDRVVLLLAGFDLTCKISPDGRICRVVPIEHPLPADFEARPRAVGSSSRQSPPEAQRQFSLRLENQPVGRVLEQLAKQLPLEVTWDEASLKANSLSRETRVSCNVAQVDLDSLLRGILEPAGMTFTRSGHRVEIRAEP